MQINKRNINSLGGILLCLWAYDMCKPLFLYVGFAHLLQYAIVLLSIIVYLQIPKSHIIKKDSLYNWFIIWTFFIIIRGSLIGNFPLASSGEVSSTSFMSSIRDIIPNALSNHHLFCFLIPLAFGFSYQKGRIADLLKLLPRISIVTCIISLMLCGLFFNVIMSSSWGMTEYVVKGETVMLRYIISRIFPCVLLICLSSFCFPYLRGKAYFWIVPITLFGYFIINVQGGGRGDSVMSFLYCVVFLVFLLKYQLTKHRSSQKIVAIAIVISVVYVLYYIFSNTDMFFFLFRRMFEGGELGTELAHDEGREYFMSCMIRYFNENPQYWFLGTGINGYYVLSGNAMRQWMEYGYMWLILKGGIVYLILFCAILLRSAYRGLFRSKNVFCKACGMICLLRVVELVPYGILDISSSSLIVWMCCGLLYGNEIRSMTDEEVLSCFNPRVGYSNTKRKYETNRVYQTVQN